MVAFGYDALTSSGGAPLSTAHNREPGLVLRPCRFDPLVADVCFEVALDDLGTDDEHLLKYGTDFQKLEDGHCFRANTDSPGNGCDGHRGFLERVYDSAHRLGFRPTSWLVREQPTRRDPLFPGLIFWGLSEAHPGATAVLVNELDTGGF